jgi:SAM-dependent methyltransferase
MSLSFRIMYRLGITPWEHADPPPTLIAMIEGPSALPKGSVLDVGCGTGGDAIYCATHGWDVTGVDASPVALRKANAKAGKVHADIRFVRADITRPGDGDLGSGHTFVLDGGCLHGLSPADLQTAITRINDATTAGATMLMFAFSPARRPLLPHGLSAEDVRSAFPGWDLVSSRPADDVELSGPARTADPSWHVLVKR